MITDAYYVLWQLVSAVAWLLRGSQLSSDTVCVICMAFVSVLFFSDSRLQFTVVHSLFLLLPSRSALCISFRSFEVPSFFY